MKVSSSLLAAAISLEFREVFERRQQWRTASGRGTSATRAMKLLPSGRRTATRA
jgi:hypothetical protein